MSDIVPAGAFPERLREPQVPARESAAPAEVSVAPVRPEERIESIDVLRGVALLGILILNINMFGLPFAAYTDPSAYGRAEGANLIVWLISHVLSRGRCAPSSACSSARR